MLDVFKRATATLAGEGSFWQDFWKAIEERYFTMDTGSYEHLDIGRGSLVTLRGMVVGIAAGVILASGFAVYDKNRLGGFVRRVISEDCLSADRAKTLEELGYSRGFGIKKSLRYGVLSRVVHCVEREEHDRDVAEIRAAYVEKNGSDKGFVAPKFVMDAKTAHFYIPDEEHYRAEVRFEKKGTSWRTFIVVAVIAVVMVSLACFFLPEILQMLDNMMGIVKDSGNNVVN